jgi:hypothetical protein
MVVVTATGAHRQRAISSVRPDFVREKNSVGRADFAEAATHRLSGAMLGTTLDAFASMRR